MRRSGVTGEVGKGEDCVALASPGHCEGGDAAVNPAEEAFDGVGPNSGFGTLEGVTP